MFYLTGLVYLHSLTQPVPADVISNCCTSFCLMGLLWPSGNRTWTSMDYPLDNPSDLTQRSWKSWCPSLGFEWGFRSFEICSIIISNKI